MKYGLNQWSRISSLLVRKSAKECKSRWYEWLDPYIKKTEWTREEEEKLLHLAKIFPTQWRTIAPIVGRTPAQCLDHYEKLLDQAQGKTEIDDNDPRKLRPGEIDPNPETKPCRPDPVDMDDDEKEMLQECRARIANTKGKKAKRKAREKQLEEARRLATLQKQRELKAAGIDVPKPLKIRGVDYNLEIPFERKVPEGRFETQEEEKYQLNVFRQNIALQQIEMKRKDEEEKKKRALDSKRMKKLKQKNLPKAIEIINKANEPGGSILQFKTKLQLPEAQITDQELSQINKYAQGIAGVGQDGNTSATKALLGNYSQRDLMNQMQIKTPMLSTRLQQEAKNALYYKNAQTPLIGGETPVLQEPNNSNVGNSQIITPNVLLSKRNGDQGQNDIGQMLPPSKRQKTGVVGPQGNIQRLQTPLRDEMKINREDGLDSGWESSSMASGLPQGQQESHLQESIQDSLLSLPKPKHEYTLSADQIKQMEEELQAQEKEYLQKDIDMLDVEDNEEIERKEREEQLRQIEREKLKQTSVIKEQLPRPQIINQEYFVKSKNDQSLSVAERMIQEEMLKIIANDNYKYPFKGMKEIQKQPILDQFQIEDLEKAKKLISEEVDQERIQFGQEKIESKLEEINKMLRFYPGTKELDSKENKTLAEQIESLRDEFQKSSSSMEKEVKKCEKLEKGLNVLFGGYIKRELGLRDKFEKIVSDNEKLGLEKEMFEVLYNQEKKSMFQRMNDMNTFLKEQQEKENRLQMRYYNLKCEKERVEKMLIAHTGIEK